MQKSVKKRLFVVLLCLMALMALCFSLVACGGDTKYKVTITDYDTEQGTVTVTPEAEGNEYKKDTEVTVEARGKEGYVVDTFTVDTNADASLNSEGKFTFKITADTTITVTFKSTTVKVTGVALDKETLALEIGGLATKAEATLQATVSPTNATNKNVSWASDAEGIATVDSTGKVTAVAVGTANITVTTEDGGMTKTCAVTVAQHQHAAAAGATWQQDTEAGTHYKLCECGARVDEGAHSAATEAQYTNQGTTHTYTCQTCSLTVSENHNMSQEYEKDERGHWHECTKCSAQSRIDAHTTDSASWTNKGGEGHSANCTTCGYEVVKQHTPGELTSDGATGHHQDCTATGCDYKITGTHTLVDAYHGDTDHYQKCSDNCGYETETSYHSWSANWDADNHWAECKTCGFRYTEIGEYSVAPHNLSGWKVDAQGKHYKECTATSVSGHSGTECTYETEHEDHAAAAYQQGDGNGHYKICPTCGLRYAEGPHEYGSGTECTECGYKKPECRHPAESLVYTSNGGRTHKVHCDACNTDVNLKEDCSYPLDGDGWYSGDGTCEHCKVQGIYTVDTSKKISAYTGTFKNAKLKLPTTIGEDSIVGIAANAFKNITDLQEVNIPASYTSIGNSAFSGSGLIALNIPDTVTTLGTSVAANCKSLLNATIGTISGQKSQLATTFSGCSSLQSAVIKCTVSVNFVQIFKDCTALEKVVITSLPKTFIQCFSNCGAQLKIYFKCAKTAWDAVSSLSSAIGVNNNQLYFFYATREEYSAAKDSLAGYGGGWHGTEEVVEEWTEE